MSHPENEPQQPNEGHSEQVRVQHVTARVPESVKRGAFSTGVIVMTGGTEFVLDFIQAIGHPAQIVARVILPHTTMAQFIEALRKNYEMYTGRFGEPPELPRNPPGARQQSAQEIYDELKLPEELMSGAYANGVMIGHSAAEFKFDFLTNLFPTSAVSARVFLSAPQIPRMLESLSKTYQQFQQRLRPPREGDFDPPSEELT